MLPFHRKLAEDGLAAIAEFGFVLAGGYAISANGMGERPSQEVDMFTNRADPAEFAVAVERLREAYLTNGFHVEDIRIRPTFADLHVSDRTTGAASSVQLGLDFRAFPPAILDIGPVLDPRDAVGAKMSALWSRGEARDYIDIDTVIDSGRFNRDDVLAIADQLEASPPDRRTLATRFREASRHDEEIFAQYDVDVARRTTILANFNQWADQIDPPPTATDGSVPAPTLPPQWETIEPAPRTDPRRHPLPGNNEHPDNRHGIGR